MKNFFLSILLLTPLLGFSTERSEWQYINIVQTGTAVNRISIWADDIPNPSSVCTEDYAQADETIPNTAMIFSAALAAFMGNKEVRLVVSDTECSESGRPLLVGIRIRG